MGADIDITNDYKGWTALMYAIANKRTEIAEILKQLGADINIRG